MALMKMPCAVGTGGGETATELWSQTLQSIGTTTLTFSKSMDDFDEIKVTYRLSTSSADDLYIKFPVETFKTRRYGVATEDDWARTFTYNSATSFTLTIALRVYASGSDASKAVPIKIEGIKY